MIELPCEKILCEVKYRNKSLIPPSDDIIVLCRETDTKVSSDFLITNRLDDVGITRHETVVPILRVPALAFLYMLGKAEAEGLSGKL